MLEHSQFQQKGKDSLMQFTIRRDFQNVKKSEPEATLRLKMGQVDNIFLSIAQRAARNRTALYQRKHPPAHGAPNMSASLATHQRNPRLRALNQPISTHYQLQNTISDGVFDGRPVLCAPISDLTANHFRPHFDARSIECAFTEPAVKHAVYGDTSSQLFYLEDEPIGQIPYSLLCYYLTDFGHRLGIIHNMQVSKNGQLPSSAKHITDGLIWWAACPPLLIDGKHNLKQFTYLDYDVRHVLGFSKSTYDEIRRDIYPHFHDWKKWCAAVRKKLQVLEKPPSAYHAGIGVSLDGETIIIVNRQATIPGLAKDLLAEGAHNAVLLDTGGSCAMWANWMNVGEGGFLTHGRIFRKERGAVLFFLLEGHCDPVYTPSRL